MAEPKGWRSIPKGAVEGVAGGTKEVFKAATKTILLAAGAAGLRWFRNIAKRSVRECDTAPFLWNAAPSASPIGPCKDCKQSRIGEEEKPRPPPLKEDEDAGRDGTQEGEGVATALGVS